MFAVGYESIKQSKTTERWNIVGNKVRMNSKQCILLCVALFQQVVSQTVVDTFDPTKPRPGATLPASIDPYGWSRPLPPNIDPLGVSYRPAVAGAALPALYDPFGASRPGGIPFIPDGYGAYGRYGGYGNYGGFGNYGFPRPAVYPSYPGYTPFGMDNWTGYRPTLTTNIGSPIIPENTAATLTTNAPLNYPPPVQPTVINTLPVAVPVPVSTNTVSVPTVTPVNTAPINTAVPALPNFSPMSFPTGAGFAGFNGGGFAGPSGGLPSFTGMGANTGGLQVPSMGSSNGNLQIPGMGMNTGNLPMPSLGLPVGAGTSTSTGNGNPSSLLPPLTS